MYGGSELVLCPLGWLSPHGDFIDVAYYDHLAKAEELVKENYALDKGCDPDDEILMNHGWAHITQSFLDGPEILIMFYGHLTQSQKDYLKPIVEDNWDWISNYWKSDLNRELELDYEVDWRN